MQYAKNTEVSVEKSRAEIERLVMRYGATGFISGWLANRSTVAFEMKDRRLRFVLPLPSKDENQFLYARGWKRRSESAALEKWEQACRQKWRALLLSIKAKLEAVESGIASFDQEMMPYVVLPDGQTIAETILPGLPDYLTGKSMPPLLPA